MDEDVSLWCAAAAPSHSCTCCRTESTWPRCAPNRRHKYAESARDRLHSPGAARAERALHSRCAKYCGLVRASLLHVRVIGEMWACTFFFFSRCLSRVFCCCCCLFPSVFDVIGLIFGYDRRNRRAHKHLRELCEGKKNPRKTLYCSL